MSAVANVLFRKRQFNASHGIKKLKTFSQSFWFSKSKVNFQHFQKKDDAHSLFISEGTACEKRGSIYV